MKLFTEVFLYVKDLQTHLDQPPLLSSEVLTLWLGLEVQLRNWK